MLRRRAVAAHGSIFNDGPMKNLTLHHAGRFPQMSCSRFSDRRYFRRRHAWSTASATCRRMILTSFEMLRRPRATGEPDPALGEHLDDEFGEVLTGCSDAGRNDTLPLAGRYFRTITKDLMWDNKLFNDTMTVAARAKLADIKVPVLHAVAEHDQSCLRSGGST